MNKSLIMLVAAMLLLTACSGSSTPKERPLYSGSDGVKITFPRENSRTLYAQDMFTISVRLENDGASDVDKGWLTVLYDPAAFQFNQSQIASGTTVYKGMDVLPMPFSLRGRSEFVQVGEVDFADFTFIAHNVSGNRDKATSSITFQECYPYNTTFMGNVCIDRDIYNTQTTKVCLEHALTGSSQGAPIAVTKVEPSFLFNGGQVQPRFKITLQNLGSGYTLWNETLAKQKNSKELCNQRAFNRAEFGRIKVNASINNIALECGSGVNKDGTGHFDTNTVEIICTYPADPVIRPGSNYEAPIVIQAQYFYVSSLTAEFEVANVEANNG